MKTEGYWRDTEKVNKTEFHYCLPWPKVTPGWDNTQILELLDKAEKKAKVHYYKGFSASRLTGETNGSREYELNGWRWPQGFRHYVEHGVMPSAEFIEFLTNEIWY